MWCVRGATVPDTFNPKISALRPSLLRLITDLAKDTEKKSHDDL